MLLAKWCRVGMMGEMNTVTAEQLEAVRQWAGEGVDLNGIQKRLAAECGVHMTYMDVRFLLLDHGIEIATASAPAPEKKPDLLLMEQSSGEPSKTEDKLPGEAKQVIEAVDISDIFK